MRAAIPGEEIAAKDAEAKGGGKNGGEGDTPIGRCRHMWGSTKGAGRIQLSRSIAYLMKGSRSKASVTNHLTCAWLMVGLVLVSAHPTVRIP